MNRMENDRLKQAGWTAGTTAEFLGLTDEEAALIEMKLALAQSLREHRDARQLTQEQLARVLLDQASRALRRWRLQTRVYPWSYSCAPF